MGRVQCASLPAPAMKKKKMKTPPRRNPLVAAVMKKGVRRHGRTTKAQRRADKVALKRDVY